MLIIKMDGEPIGLSLDVILERLGQRLGVVRRPHALGLYQARDRAIRALRRLPGARQHEAQKIARRLARGERLLGQARGELALEAQHQLDAREAVEPEVALERAV